MSRAFVKEDVDPPERRGRKRSVSGLPPGAANYITARGAARLRGELEKLRRENGRTQRITELERILAAVEIVPPPETDSKDVSLGAMVTLEDAHGRTEIYTIVGVEELEFEPHAVSWISPLGKALLASRLGERITLPDGRAAKIIRIASG